MKKKVSDLEVETDSLKRENGILRCELSNLAVNLNTTNKALTLNNTPGGIASRLRVYHLQIGRTPMS